MRSIVTSSISFLNLDIHCLLLSSQSAIETITRLIQCKLLSIHLLQGLIGGIYDKKSASLHWSQTSFKSVHWWHSSSHKSIHKAGSVSLISFAYFWHDPHTRRIFIWSVKKLFMSSPFLEVLVEYSIATMLSLMKLGLL